MREWIILRPLIGMLFSRKFLALLLAALVASGVSWASGFEQWIPVILVFGSGLYATLTAWEDASAKKNAPQDYVSAVLTDAEKEWVTKRTKEIWLEQNECKTVPAPHMAQEPGLDVEAGE